MTERRADDNVQHAQHHISCKTASTYFIRVCAAQYLSNSMCE